MISRINFSIFVSPTDAYGNAAGKISVPDNVSVGSEVILLENSSIKGFTGKLRVQSITKLDGDELLLVELADVVVNSVSDADTLIHELECEAGLYFDSYR